MVPKCEEVRGGIIEKLRSADYKERQQWKVHRWFSSISSDKVVSKLKNTALLAYPFDATFLGHGAVCSVVWCEHTYDQDNRVMQDLPKELGSDSIQMPKQVIERMDYLRHDFWITWGLVHRLLILRF